MDHTLKYIIVLQSFKYKIQLALKNKSVYYIKSLY